MKRRFFSCLLLIVIVIFLAGCGGKESTKQENKSNAIANSKPLKEIDVGATYALTGPAAIYSRAIVNAINMAKEEINSSGGVTLKIDLQDDRTQKDEAINLYKKFIERDKKLVIIGPLLGKQVFAAAPIAQENKTPVLLTSVATPGVTKIGDYIFRTSVESANIIPLAVKEAKNKLNIQNICSIYAKDDEFALGEYKAFEKALKENGINIIDTETFLTGDVDFRSQLTNIKNAKPDAVVIAAQGEEVVSISTQARQLGIPQDVRFIGGNAFNATNVIKEAGKAMEGSISATPWFLEMENEKNKAFVKKYKEKFGENPDWLSAQTYDAMYILKQVFENAGITEADSISDARKKFRDALAKIKSFDGVLGKFGFDDIGDPTVSGVVITVKDGKHVLFK